MLERRIWMIGNVAALLLLVLSARIIYWQLWRGQELQPVALNPVQAVIDQPGGSSNPGARPTQDPETAAAIEELMRQGGLVNLGSLPQPVAQRTAAFMGSITRGSIYDRSGQLLAYDQPGEQGTLQRTYTEPAFAHVLGYTTGIRTGVTGLELNYNQTLLGMNRLDTQLGLLTHQPIKGSDLVLTVDAGLQRLAEQALGGRRGAAVVLDGDTGAVLAMASTPRFDPNRIYERDYTANLLASCDADPACQSPFLNRASQGLYSPGSTWKTVTLIAALDTGLVQPDTVIDFGPPAPDPNRVYYIYEVDGFPILDPNHPERFLSLELSFAKSANAAFARFGHEMDPGQFVRYANQLGFIERGQNTFPIEIPFSSSQLANEQQDIIDNNVLRAVTAIGQGELLTNPLNMAMVVLAVLNDGDMPIPYFVHTINSPEGLRTPGPVRSRQVRNIFKPSTARIVHDMMLATVEQGYANAARVDGLVVGGKTGTAQLGGDQLPHAWFIGFAKDGENSVVIAVLLENAGSGSTEAAPIFARLAGPALQSLRAPVIERLPAPESP
jgi:penicillin-binding protein A